MSVVDTIVFITPDHKAGMRFEEIIKTKYDRYSTPIYVEAIDRLLHTVHDSKEAGGTKVAGDYLYYLGMNYLNVECVDALKAEPWPEGSVLYLHGECYGKRQDAGWGGYDIVGPDVTVF